MAAALAVVLAASCSSNGGSNAAVNGADSTAVKTVNPNSLKPSRAQIDSASYLMGINFGSFIKGYNFSKDGKDLNYKLIQKGIIDFLNAEGNYSDPDYAKQFKISPESMNEVFNSYLAKRRDYTMALNKEKETKFLAENQKKDSVQVSASGLQYIIRAAGNDVKPSAEDTVFVHYKGTLLDGTTFDESPANDEGIRMLLNRVIAGTAYEFIRLAGRYDNWFVNLLSKPGLLMQKMTTREPDDEMIEVGIASVEAVFDWRKWQKEENV